MLSLTSATRVLVATRPVDLRGSFNRLYGLVVEQLKGDPLSGHLYVFTNCRNRLKVLYWDGDGLWVCAKRLICYISRVAIIAGSTAVNLQCSRHRC